MDFRQTSHLLTKVLTITLLILPISILPFSAIDPINTPQLTVLIVASFVLLGVLIASRKAIGWYRYRFLLTLLAAFVLNLLFVLIFSKASLELQFYGGFGRNTGLLTYWSLSIVLFAAALVVNEDNAKRFAKSLLYVGMSATAYGFIQYLGLDPVPWDNDFSPVIGFLGNPNFQSALLGICGVVVFTNIMQKSAIRRIRALSVFCFFVLLFVVIQTDSRQGLLNLLAGILVVIWIYVKEKHMKKVNYIFTAFVVSGGTLTALGIFNYGPLGDYLYKQSVSTRVFYWEAALKMTLEKPIWGVGLDNYGDWYRRLRTEKAATEFGPDSVSDVAHNVFLGFSSNGGLPLLLVYLAMISITIMSIIRVIKRQNSFNLTHSALVGAWVSYQIQSLISINQLSLVFIGWVLTGLLIGYDFSTQRDQKSTTKKSAPRDTRFILPPKYVLVIFASSTLGFLVGAQPMISSIKFRSALESGQIERIRQSSELRPLEPLRIYQVASILRDNKFEKEAIQVLEFGIQNFPDNFILWRLLGEFPEIPESQLKIIREKMRTLDPYNKQI